MSNRRLFTGSKFSIQVDVYILFHINYYCSINSVLMYPVCPLYSTFDQPLEQFSKTLTVVPLSRFSRIAESVPCPLRNLTESPLIFLVPIFPASLSVVLDSVVLDEEVAAESVCPPSVLLSSMRSKNSVFTKASPPLYSILLQPFG